MRQRGEGSAERLLLCCARARLDGAGEARLKAVVQEPIDWDRAERLARGHGVAPLLYWHLNRVCPESVPADLLARFRGYFTGNAHRNLMLSGELVQLLALLETHEIPVIPYKGPVLAAALYGNLAFREFLDLDLLIRKRDLPRVTALLFERGYRLRFELTDAQVETIVRSQYELGFAKGPPDVKVEIHWGVARQFAAYSVELDEVWPRLHDEPFAGRTVKSFPPEETLLLLCAHGAKHCWMWLKWIGDIAELLAIYPALDWELIWREARARGSLRMVLLGLALARDVLGAEAPTEVAHRIARDKAVAPLVAQVRERLFVETESTSRTIEAWTMKISARERLRDRLGYYAHLPRLVLTPTESEHAALPVSPRLAPLRYLTRPIRLAAQYGRLVLKRLAQESPRDVNSV